uniref:cadherin-like domain-containing protein n=1 Tax=uncultured Algibacter sp. TaxID=298659 RepID=UPI0026060713
TDSSELNITVDPITDPISDDNETVSTNEDTPVSGDLFANLTDADSADHTITGATVDTDGDGNPEALVLGTPTTINNNTGDPIGDITVNADGTFIFTPASNYNGPVPTIGYDIVDDNDASDTNSSELNITVDPVDDLPLANNDGGTTDPGVDIIIDITVNDIGYEATIDDLTIDLDPNTPGQQNTFTVLGEGTFTDNGDGTVTFSPEPGYTDGITTITYTVNDNVGNTSNEATITVVVPLCTSTLDTDGDGLTDCEETTGIDDPSTPEDPTTFLGGPISDPNNPCDPIGINTTDTDGDGLTDCEETTG